MKKYTPFLMYGLLYLVLGFLLAAGFFWIAFISLLLVARHLRRQPHLNKGIKYFYLWFNIVLMSALFLGIGLGIRYSLPPNISMSYSTTTLDEKVEADRQTRRISYELTIHSGKSAPMLIKKVTPLFAPPSAHRILSNDDEFGFHEIIDSQESVVLHGELVVERVGEVTDPDPNSMWIDQFKLDIKRRFLWFFWL
ncbi:MAG: hypothetical protein ACE3L7_17585 [Candidatus Pristimantibacillus sp.]